MNCFSLYQDLNSDELWVLVFEHLSDVGELDVGLSHIPPLHGKATFNVKFNLKRFYATMQTASSVRFENTC